MNAMTKLIQWLRNKPRGIEIPKIKARLGPLDGGIIVPPLTVRSELCIGIPAIVLPVEKVFFKD